MPNISSILPTYNRADLLPRAINSAIQQTYSDWELIIWDDGSTDNTTKTLKGFVDTRIRYFTDHNHGAAYARNRALEKANGRYVAFLDSDDEWMNEKLALQVRALEDHPGIGILFSDFQNINLTKGEKGRGFLQNADAMSHLSIRIHGKELFEVTKGMPESLALGNFIATDTVMIHRKFINQYGNFNESLRNSEDFELWWRLGLSGVRFAYLDEILMTRYKPPNSLSSQGQDSSHSALKALDLCRENSLCAGKKGHQLYLRRLYRNTWQNLILAYGQQGKVDLVFRAFFNSCRYGVRPGTMKLLFKTIHELLRT